MLRLTLAQVAPVLPYLVLVLILIVRPKGLLGTREELMHHASLHYQPLNLGRWVVWG